MLYPQNGDRILTIDSVTTLHPVYSPRFGIAYQFRPTTHARQYAGHPGAFFDSIGRNCIEERYLQLTVQHFNRAPLSAIYVNENENVNCAKRT